MMKLTMVVTGCAAALLTGCTKSDQQQYSVQAMPLLGGQAMMYHVTDHKAGKLYTYGSGPTDSALMLIQTIDLSSTGQQTLTVESPKKEDREQESSGDATSSRPRP